MVHTFQLAEKKICLDVASGAVYTLDDTAFQLIQKLTKNDFLSTPELDNSADAEAYEELKSLFDTGQLFADDTAPTPPANIPLKALCLHISHDCNLRCAYCFAGTGDFGTGQRVTMDSETARRAVDVLVARSGARTELEIDFFGGEPLLGWQTVLDTVAYARSIPGKHFRFTLTTNGLALTDDIIETLNETMDNVVLSLDGRREVHDKTRRTVSGQGSYDLILPKLKRFAALRGDREFFIRGTYTAQNLDFVADVEALVDAGFKQISLEPVVLPPSHPLAIREEHLPGLFAQYDLLYQKMRNGADFQFFHFEVDLEEGPCVYKRMKGCGAGVEYAAVTPSGHFYPCHQFAEKPEFCLGSAESPDFGDVSDLFRHRVGEDCPTCWAKYFCGGGCAAANLTVNGSLTRCDTIGCALMKKRLECAIALRC